MKTTISTFLAQAIGKLTSQIVDVNVTHSEHANFTSNVAFVLAKNLRQSPWIIAQNIVAQITEKPNNIGTFVAEQPGFINVYLHQDQKCAIVNNLYDQKADVGKRPRNQKRINIEYVSANPTGYLHVGHARNAAIGASLANIMEYAGYQVDREYYVNDAGNQMNILALSVYYRYMELLGKGIPEEQKSKDIYAGQEIMVCAQAVRTAFGDKFAKPYDDEICATLRDFGRDFFLGKIQEHLAEFRTKFDIYFSERNVDRAAIDKAIKAMKHTYVKDGAVWFQSTFYGDDKDRVLIKSDNTTTYFAPDVVYHKIKASRHDYYQLIDVLGGDHSGYAMRINAALQDLGYKDNLLNVVLMQMVKLIKNDTNLKMSKRLGTSITMKSLMDEVGVDAMRYYLTSKTSNTEIELDVDLAKSSRSENQVFYIQYAHARICQLLAKAAAADVAPQPLKTLEFTPEVEALFKKLVVFPDLISDVAENKLIHLVNAYLLALAGKFHSYYNSEKVLHLVNAGEHLTLVILVKNVLARGLDLLGISAPNKM